MMAAQGCYSSLMYMDTDPDPVQLDSIHQLFHLYQYTRPDNQHEHLKRVIEEHKYFRMLHHLYHTPK